MYEESGSIMKSNIIITQNNFLNIIVTLNVKFYYYFIVEYQNLNIKSIVQLLV